MPATEFQKKGTTMSKRRIGAAAAIAGLLATAAITAATTSANADASPQAKDVVGVGSDIVQNAMDFLADGAPNGDEGFNSAGNRYRVFSFDASADANGRGAFTDPALGTSVLLNPTAVLRAGTSPVQRPNGGGAGLSAILADGSGGTSSNLIQFVRSPNLPTAANQTTATANLGSQLHSVRIATDEQYIATAATTNAPSTGLTFAQLANIYCSNSAHPEYTTWHDVDPTDSSTDTIIPEAPQDGAGVLKIFQAGLQVGNGGTACAFKTSVLRVQQNDPTTITNASTPADAIVPFPQGRYDLYNAGYFHDPSKPYNSTTSFGSGTALSASGIKLQVPGAAGVAAGAFSETIPYYIVFRDADATSTNPIPWEPGSTLSWVQTLFYNADYDYTDPSDPANPPA
jgi:ABC-type phosphate transport system substrate-binding protein